jgi:hypothetical protein
MFKKYFLILILFIFSFNAFSTSNEHRCHEEMKMSQTMKHTDMNEECDCCDDNKIEVKNCECDNCEFSQSFFITNINFLKDSKSKNYLNYYEYKHQNSFQKNTYKPPILI